MEEATGVINFTFRIRDVHRGLSYVKGMKWEGVDRVLLWVLLDRFVICGRR